MGNLKSTINQTWMALDTQVPTDNSGRHKVNEQTLLSLEIYYLDVSWPLSNSKATLPHITREHYLPSGISLSSLILPRPSFLNGHHSHSLIGDCEFCHNLINVQVSAHSGSSAPVGTSVRAHPCSHRGVRRRKAHTHFHPYAHASYCHFGY